MRTLRRAPAWRPHPTDVAMMAVLGGFAVLGALRTSGYYFVSDELLMIQQASSASGFVTPYNGHLSLVVLAVLRALVEGFGFRHEPFQVLAVAGVLAPPLALYVTTRPRLGRWLAGVLSLSLFAAGGLAFLPAEVNHHLALLGAIGCAWALEHPERSTGWLVASLCLSLSSAGGGVAVAVACIVHCACVRAPAPRWWAVIVPSGLWVAWSIASSDDVLSGSATTWSEVAETTWQVIGRSFVALGLHRLALGALALALFGLLGGSLLQAGLRAAASWLAWTAALVVWALGITLERADNLDPAAFRYQYFAIGLILLAVVPRHPLPSGVSRASLRLAPLVGTAVVLLVGGLRLDAAAEAPDASEKHERASVLNRARFDIIQIDPPVVDDRRRLPFPMGGLTAGELRDLIRRYGAPKAPQVDRQLVDEGVIVSSSVPRGPARCDALEEPALVVNASGPRRLVLWTLDVDVRIEIRRFEEEWLFVDELPVLEGRALSLPGLESDVPWQVRADGACVRS